MSSVLLKLSPSVITMFSTLECSWLKNFLNKFKIKSFRWDLFRLISAEFEVCMHFPRQTLEREDGSRQGRDQLMAQQRG